MSNAVKIALVVMAGLAVVGCNRSSNALSINTQSPPQPLPSAPSGDIQSSTLDPISADLNNQVQNTVDENQPNTDLPTVDQAQNAAGDQLQVASLEPQQQEVAAQPITHEGLAGAWNVGANSAGCRVFLSFTKWSGGYRAGSRQCSAELASVSAWDVKNNRVVLVDSNGGQIASLSSTGTERYSGTTTNGSPISFSR
ncbi:MAG: protease inhibitor Inh/omp19 family protein [Pseudomonadota bacterium]